LRVAAAVAALLGLVAPARPENKPAEKVKIRPTYEQGRRLRYQLKLSGTTAWAPSIEGVTWGRMKTDFTFVLATKTLREEGTHKGCCTFHLLGEHLRSLGEGPNGAFGVDTTRERTRIKVRDHWQVSVENESPLLKPMTMTFGPLGGFRFGTKLAPLAVYMLPHVDHRFWALLTVAPYRKVSPGDTWGDEFDLPVPGSKEKPLKLRGTWRAVGWQAYRRRKVLALTLQGELTIKKNTRVMLENGDLLRVSTGTCKATGKAMWDVERGVLCSATAEQKILIKAQTLKGAPRALRSESSSSLKLLAAKTPKKGR